VYLTPEDEDEPNEPVEVAVCCPAGAPLEFDYRIGSANGERRVGGRRPLSVQLKRRWYICWAACLDALA
jgi:hypothetical protein